MGRRQKGRGWKDTLVKGANLAREGLAAAEDAGIEIPDQNPFAGLSAPSRQAPGMMASLQTTAPPPQEAHEFKELLMAAKTMTPDDVDKLGKLAQAKAMLTQAQALQEQGGARRSTRSKPRHKRRAKTRRLKASKKRTGRSNRP